MARIVIFLYKLQIPIVYVRTNKIEKNWKMTETREKFQVQKRMDFADLMDMLGKTIWKAAAPERQTAINTRYFWKCWENLFSSFLATWEGWNCQDGGFLAIPNDPITAELPSDATHMGAAAADSPILQSFSKEFHWRFSSFANRVHLWEISFRLLLCSAKAGYIIRRTHQDAIGSCKKPPFLTTPVTEPLKRIETLNLLGPMRTVYTLSTH